MGVKAKPGGRGRKPKELDRQPSSSNGAALSPSPDPGAGSSGSGKGMPASRSDKKKGSDRPPNIMENTSCDPKQWTLLKCWSKRMYDAFEAHRLAGYLEYSKRGLGKKFYTTIHGQKRKISIDDPEFQIFEILTLGELLEVGENKVYKLQIEASEIQCANNMESGKPIPKWTLTSYLELAELLHKSLKVGDYVAVWGAKYTLKSKWVILNSFGDITVPETVMTIYRHEADDSGICDLVQELFPKPSPKTGEAQQVEKGGSDSRLSDVDEGSDEDEDRGPNQDNVNSPRSSQKPSTPDGERTNTTSPKVPSARKQRTLSDDAILKELESNRRSRSRSSSVEIVADIPDSDTEEKPSKRKRKTNSHASVKKPDNAKQGKKSEIFEPDSDDANSTDNDEERPSKHKRNTNSHASVKKLGNAKRGKKSEIFEPDSDDANSTDNDEERPSKHERNTNSHASVKKLGNAKRGKKSEIFEPDSDDANSTDNDEERPSKHKRNTNSHASVKKLGNAKRGKKSEIFEPDSDDTNSTDNNDEDEDPAFSPNKRYTNLKRRATRRLSGSSHESLTSSPRPKRAARNKATKVSIVELSDSEQEPPIKDRDEVDEVNESEEERPVTRASPKKTDHIKSKASQGENSKQTESDSQMLSQSSIVIQLETQNFGPPNNSNNGDRDQERDSDWQPPSGSEDDEEKSDTNKASNSASDNDSDDENLETKRQKLNRSKVVRKLSFPEVEQPTRKHAATNSEWSNKMKKCSINLDRGLADSYLATSSRGNSKPKPSTPARGNKRRK